MPGKPKLRCVVFGGGGHARVVIDAVQQSRSATLVAILDADARRWKTEVLGVPIVGNDTALDALIADGVNCFIVGVGSVGDNSVRRRLFELANGRGLRPHTVVHPAALCSPAAGVEPGAQLLAACIVNVGAHIGQNAIINTGAIIEHDCRIGAHAHVSTGAALCGSVRLEEGAFVGAGATILPNIVIHKGATVGAGAVVTRDVETLTTVVGVPARVIRRTK